MSRLNNPYSEVPFSHLCTASNKDHRQDQYLAMLERQPKSEADAQAILDTLHHRHVRAKRNDKRRAIQLNFDPPDKAPVEDGRLVELVDSLSKDDAKLIKVHLLSGQSFQAISETLGISKMATCKRYNKALAKLTALYNEHYK
jgi:DNA-directed RNA polymerase specialized sigma24 family protein